MAIDKALYTAHATSTGGRTGSTESSDGKIKLQLSTPKELGGDNGPGTNPEQLFASGYSACFIGAMKAVARNQKISLPAEVSIQSSVSIGNRAYILSTAAGRSRPLMRAATLSASAVLPNGPTRTRVRLPSLVSTTCV